MVEGQGVLMCEWPLAHNCGQGQSLQEGGGRERGWPLFL
jgi:hypothetical protein